MSLPRKQGCSETERPSASEPQRSIAPQGEPSEALSFPAKLLSSVSPAQAGGDAGLDDSREAASDCYELPEAPLSLGIEPACESFLASIDGAKAPESLQLETRGLTSQKNSDHQGEFWRKQTIHKNTVAAKLRTVGEKDRADKLEFCHTEAIWATCTGCRKAKRFLNRCERFYCPECQPTLAKQRARQVEWWTREIDQPKHVVLTLQNFPTLTKDLVRHAKKCLAKLRRTVFAKKWRGGFYSMEVTNEGKGWHLHFHLLIDARWIDAIELGVQWNKVNGGWGRIVKVKDCRQGDYIKEVTKYAVKGNMLASWTGSEIAEFITAFDGVRTFGVFGSLYGKRTKFKEWIAQIIDTALTCSCGCQHFWYQTDADYQLGDVRLSSNVESRPPPVSDFQLMLTGTM